MGGFVHLGTGGRYFSNSSVANPGADFLVLSLGDMGLDYNPGAVTYGGVALTLGKTASVGSRCWSQIYYLVNPPSGTNTLAVGTWGYGGWAMWFRGVLQGATPVHHTYAYGSLGDTYITASLLTEKAGDLIIYSGCYQPRWGGWSNITLGSSYVYQPAASIGAAFEIENVAGSETGTWGWSEENRISLVGVSFKQIVGGANEVIAIPAML